jgi:hypothetical protein
MGEGSDASTAHSPLLFGVTLMSTGCRLTFTLMLFESVLFDALNEK